MIHAYHDNYLDLTKSKLGSIFENAVNIKKINLSDFEAIFLNSYISKAFEEADPVYICGKSSPELLGLILNEEPVEVMISEMCSPEYWLGYVLAYSQWYLNKSFKEILNRVSCEELILNYFPYHEMDISKTVDLIKSKMNLVPNLKRLRENKGYSQNKLADLSGVSLRAIKAYEQETLDISKANVETVYKLSKTLNTTIEELIKQVCY